MKCTAKRNALGVQLLSRSLHAQLFAHSAAPPPPDAYVAIARAHLRAHGLDPAQGALLPDVDFTLPPLQGPDLAAHFDAIGERAAHPWAALADGLASAELPPVPEHWDAAPGWTKYTHAPGGGSFHEHVEYPDEDALVFDVETLPHISPYAVLATAASRTAWYAWVSPWLLGHTDDVVQLPSLGPRSAPRLVVGHNVSYDRLRLADEYHVAGTRTRFLDTMALHVALAGISAHQRPALAAHRARKARLAEGVEGLLCALDERAAAETDPAKRAELEKERDELAADTSVEDDDGGGPPDGRWEDLTALNSLADVAALHCGIEVDKSTRDDFLVSSREEIRAGLQDYLAYCAADVRVTHQVYGAVYPPFRAACPSPVSLAGVLAMGSAFLPVNQEWERYLARAEAAYRARSDSVRARLLALAEEARALADGVRWRGDPWLEQMDWTPKKVGKSRGLVVPVRFCALAPPRLVLTDVC
jgi:DNA polymerase gamma 1